MGIPLKARHPEPDRKPFKFGVCDIEASDWINFLVIGYYSESYDEEDNVDEDILRIFEDMDDCCDWFFEKEQPHNVIFAHFGGNYDFQFIMKNMYFRKEKFYIDGMIPRGSGLLCFSASTMKVTKRAPKKADRIIKELDNGHYLIKDRTIEFRDSSAFLPFSLASITENFGVEHKKLSIDYEKIKEVTPELIEYLTYDLKGLYQSIRKYYDWPIIKAAGPASTMASQALRVYQTYMYSDIPSLNEGVDTYVRQSYFGGRTEIFKPFFRQCDPYKLLKTYDVNSLYPYVMRQFEYPTKFKGEVFKYYENEMGFYDVEVEVPDMYVPPLGTVFDPDKWGRFIFPTGKFRGKWSTIELNYAMSLGVKITKVYNGLLFHSGGHIFRAYIDHLYSLRKSSKKNSVDDILCKLLMNSLYGRFGLQIMRETVDFDYGQLDVSPHMEILVKDDEYIRLLKSSTALDKSFNNVAIPAWVTSHARIHMHKHYMPSAEELYYTDTDSLFTTHTFPDNDKELGEMKLEYKSKAACFLLPKTYLADTLSPIWKGFMEDGKETKSSKKIVMKGFDKKKISKFQLEDFISALEGDLRRLRTTNPAKFATFKTALSNNKFLMLLKESPREIRSRYDKRRIIYTGGAQEWDTEPLHIKDNVIVNKD